VHSNPGGLIIDVTGTVLSDNEVIDAILNRLNRPTSYFVPYVIVKKDDRIVKLFELTYK
jgi:hypothetical protein